MWWHIALNIDAHCGDAYLGRVLAANKTDTIKGLFKARLELYLEATKSFDMCCYEETELIKNTIKECAIPGYLESRSIKAMYEYNLWYETRVECRKEQYATEEKYLKSDKLIKRTLQFLNEPKKKEFEDTINAILRAILELLKNAENEAKEMCDKKIAEYKNHLDKVTKKVKKLHEKAIQMRAENYQASCEKFEKAQTIESYEKLAQEFETYGDYKDSLKRIEECHSKIDEIIKSKEEATRKSRKKIGILISTVFIAVAVLLSALDVMKNNDVRQQLIGKEFIGTYRDSYRYIHTYEIEEEISIKIVDEKYCNISVIETKRINGEENVETQNYDNAPYFLNGGLLGVEFNWKSGEIYHSSESFQVEIEDGKITMYTPNYNGNAKSLTLNEI